MTTPTVDRLPFTDDDEANRLLVEDPFALLIGFTLDQQVPLQKAFSGPLELRRRIGPYDARRIATMPPDELDEVFRRVPALHRFPSNMAKRTQAVAAFLVERYGGDAARLWRDASDGQDLHRRLLEVPGFGPMKAGTLVAILGKQLGVTPPGWQAQVPDHMTLGDVDGPERLREYQGWKKQMKAAARDAAGQ
ncbi:MAG TPA: HhH-GPD-type base excision DNA repair protein [Candidatus Limnocylindrales bacterium]|nr:HhH-GPD-type base excision DNA repair protein [Candidatus Limnocylindrales bacterium]